MRRRVIKQKTAFTVTLPIKWVREHHLKPSEELEITEENSALVISAEKRTKTDEITLFLEKGNDSYYRIMIENHYLKGYDVLNVEFSEERAFNKIQQIVANLIGFEIVEQHKNTCRISSTATPTNEEFERLLRRCFTIINCTQDIIQKDLQRMSFENYQNIEDYTKDTRRFLLFCTRALHKNAIVDRRNESFLHLLLERLILIQHNHYYLYKKLCTLKKHNIRKQVIQLYAKACMMFTLFSEMFYKKSLRQFATINHYWENIYFKEGHELFAGCTKEESFVIYHAMHLSKMVFLTAQPNLTLQLAK